MRSEVIATGLVDHDLHLLGAHGLYFGSIDVRTGGRLVHVTWGDIEPSRHTPSMMATHEQTSAIVRLTARLENIAAWLPASAWKDREIRAYVPPGYSVCIQGKKGLGLSRILALLPPRAAHLLRGQENTRQHYTNLIGTFHNWCSELTNDEARALERVLDRAGLRSTKDVFGVVYGKFDPGFYSKTDFSLTFYPLLPEQE